MSSKGNFLTNVSSFKDAQCKMMSRLRKTVIGCAARIGQRLTSYETSSATVER